MHDPCTIALTLHDAARYGSVLLVIREDLGEIRREGARPDNQQMAPMRCNYEVAKEPLQCSMKLPQTHSE